MTTNYLTRDHFGMYADNTLDGPGPELMGANTLLGNHVSNLVSRHQPSVGGGDFDRVQDVAEVGRKMREWKNISSPSAPK